MMACERLRLFAGEVADANEAEWVQDPPHEAVIALWRVAVEQNLRQAAELLSQLPSAAADAFDAAVVGCAEAWLRDRQVVLDPEEHVLAAVERYSPLLALRLQCALQAHDPQARLHCCVGVFQAVFGEEPSGIELREVRVDQQPLASVVGL